MKKLISCVLFLAIVVSLLSVSAEILTPKFQNRYYVLEDYLENNPENNYHDVQVFGSCHSYTSFNPVYMEERTGISGYVYGNAGEIIPTTYVRMVEQFKKHTPKVALVEIWGMNPYETYSPHKNVFGTYLANNLERTKFSWAKQEVIWDFKDKDYQDINLLTMNFPALNYKERVIDDSLTDLDFDYNFEEAKSLTSRYNYREMLSRFTNNGYKIYDYNPVEDYPQQQSVIEPGEMVEIEPDIVKYIQKIIDLCEKNDVELIFYRSPYRSTANELKKLNHLYQICDENDVLFVDLEAEIEYDYTKDFLDYEHLSEIGANKSTEFLLDYILDAFGETGEKQEIQRENLLTGELLDSSAWQSNFQNVYQTKKGVCTKVDESRAGWLLYQDVEGMDAFWEQSVTVHFSIAAHYGTEVAPLISFRNEEGKEFAIKKGEMVDGESTISAAVPEGTAWIRVGLYAWDGCGSGNFITVNDIEMYQGAFTVDCLPTVIE